MQVPLSSRAGVVEAEPEPEQGDLLFTFREPPFADAPDGRFVHLDDVRGRIVSSVIADIGRASALVTVVGECGAGKSSLLLAIADAVTAAPDADLLYPQGVYRCQAETSFNDILAACRSGPGFASLATYLPASRYVRPRGADDRPTTPVLLLDDVDSLKPTVLDYLVRLHRLLAAKGAFLTTIMTSSRLPRVLQEITLAPGRSVAERTVTLGPFGAVDIAPLIRHRLAAAGHTGLNPFSDEACGRIASLTGGRLALVTRLCNHCLDMAIREFAFPILPSLVDQVAASMSLPKTKISDDSADPPEDLAASAGGEMPLTSGGDEKLPFVGKPPGPLPNPHPVSAPRLARTAERVEAPVPARVRLWPVWAAAFLVMTLGLGAVIGTWIAGLVLPPNGPAPAMSETDHRPAPADTPIATASGDSAEAEAPDGDAEASLVIAPASVVDEPPHPMATLVPSVARTAVNEASMSVAELLQRGDALLARNDMASAGPFYRLAMEQGSGKGALRLAMTMDPVVLGARGLPVKRGRAEEALAWYERAAALGENEALDRRARLDAWLREQEPRLPPRE